MGGLSLCRHSSFYYFFTVVVVLLLELQLPSASTALGRNDEEGGREGGRAGGQKGGLCLCRHSSSFIN